MRKSIKVDALIPNWSLILKFLNENMDAAKISPAYKQKIILASEEIYINIARYAYPESSGTALMDFEYDDRIKLVKIKFTDSGIPFNPLCISSPDITQPLDKRKIGGLGIFIVKKVMDDLEYNYHSGQNNLVLIKKIDNSNNRGDLIENK